MNPQNSSELTAIARGITLEAAAGEGRLPARNLDPTKRRTAAKPLRPRARPPVIAPHPPRAAPIGSLIAGRYKLREQIGDGGMGTVYLAEQTRPVKRKVALKLIREGMGSEAVAARFELERQALALMDHPNIAKVFDAGTTESGRPFFVMELVKGIPLTTYCDEHRLDLPARLQLFRQICSAVQHAHQKGIIHRDLKPSNILVESHDGRAVPKVIDFGLAKATSGLQLSEHSLYTAVGTVAGTPLYMAPEQASFNALDVDTRADIYALGVILYELLTGSTPIERGTIKSASLEDVLRMIREVDPPTPSSRLRSSDSLPSLAAVRQTEPARLGRFLRGDLDWIVMKALAKDRQRRYDSAISLANDVERFTNHEPVSAGPPTASYRLGKFLRRNRGRAIAASLVLLALVCGIIGTTLGLIEANRQRGFAETRRQEAEKRLGQKDKANEILLTIFRDLDEQGSDNESLPLPARLAQRLDVATAEMVGEATDDPLGVARMQLALAKAQLSLGYAERAIDLITRARTTYTDHLGSNHPDTLKSMIWLSSGYLDLGKLNLAVPLLEETLTLMKANLGPDHPDTLSAMNDLAVCYRRTNRLDLALPLYEEALRFRKARLGLDHRHTLESMHNLAVAYQFAGKIDLALPLYAETLAIKKAKLGPDHRETLATMHNLGWGYQYAGRLDLAIPLLEETLAQEGKVRPRPPRRLVHDAYTRHQLLRRRPARSRPADPRGHRGDQEGEAWPRPSRPASRHGQPRPGLSRLGTARPRIADRRRSRISLEKEGRGPVARVRDGPGPTRPGPARVPIVGASRIESARMPGDSGIATARRVVDLQHEIDARRCAAR